MEKRVVDLDLMLGLPTEFEAHLTSLIDFLKYSNETAILWPPGAKN